jgi:uncharacterized protein VirK/YbjX
MTRATLIAKSFISLINHSYNENGFARVLKDIADTIFHFDIVLMMTRSDTVRLLKYHPTLLNGRLWAPYLARSFDHSRRLRYTILVSHYTYLADRISETFYERVEESGLTLWSAELDGERLRISIGFEKKDRQEGDLTLSFEMNRVMLYQVSFTIVTGILVGCSAQKVLLVGRVQGTRARFDEIRRATQLCHKTAPPYLLVISAQAVAFELDIDLVVGVNSREQLTKAQGRAYKFPFDYNSFWKSCTATENSRTFYALPAWFLGHPVGQVSSEHRRRARLKRKFERELNECVRAAFAEKCLAKKAIF